ncbi:unnamed protein product [Menidia menidia]|uniref:(Atlantic silverside) hypothetical protein n=1 Tax=Menidia menidia TaxID=238744 RepID=A0A8S4C373_9TELE|nr:unnamed protein product [Menidia menidia]
MSTFHSGPPPDTYTANRSPKDAITKALHTTLNHLENLGSYMSMLSLDCSSAFNHIILDILVRKLSHLGVPTPICL